MNNETNPNEIELTGAMGNPICLEARKTAILNSQMIGRRNAYYVTIEQLLRIVEKLNNDKENTK